LTTLLVFFLLKPVVNGGFQIVGLIAVLAIIAQGLIILMLPARPVKG
jgi:hypothetical protein